MNKKILFSIICISIISFTSYADIYPIKEGNKITIIEDEYDSLEIKLKLIQQAQYSIHITTYFWDNSKVGKLFVKALRKAADRGINVSVVTNRHINNLKDIAQSLRRYITKPTKNNYTINYLDFSTYIKGYAYLNNIHEKIFLIDGKIAIIGGRNFSSDIFDLKDLDFQIQGPIVTDLHKHFFKVHAFTNNNAKNFCIKKLDTKDIFYNNKKNICIKKYEKRKLVSSSLYFPENPPYANGVKMKLITNNVLEIQRIKKYNRKKREKYLPLADDIINTIITKDFNHLKFYNFHANYTDNFLYFLEKKLKENKKIEIITNGRKSTGYYIKTGYVMALKHMKKVTKWGATFFTWEDLSNYKFLHVKALIFDDNLSIIGSHNLSKTSSTLGSEIVLEVHSKDFAQQLINIFENDKQYTIETNLNYINNEIKYSKKYNLISTYIMRPFYNIISDFF